MQWGTQFIRVGIILKYIVLLLITLLSLIRPQASIPDINYGFFPENSTKIPKAVLKARPKIFQIQMPYYYKIKNKDFKDYQELKNLPETGKKALDVCVRDNESYCIVEILTQIGTAFLDTDPSALWTNCHVVSNWMENKINPSTFSKTSELFSAVRLMSLPLKLIDHEGKVVIDGTTHTKSAFIDAFSRLRIAEGWSNRCNGYDDLVKIKLSRPLAKTGLEITRENSLNGDLLYIGGVPQPTLRVVDEVDMSSDGENFYWAFGEFFDKNSEAFKQYFPKMNFAFSGYKQAFFADGAQGLSGSPVLNAFGKVVGIYQAYVPLDNKDENSPPLISIFTNASGMGFLERLAE